MCIIRSRRGISNKVNAGHRPNCCAIWRKATRHSAKRRPRHLLDNDRNDLLSKTLPEIQLMTPQSKQEHRVLGKSGLSVSAIGLGCMSLSGIYGAADDAVSENLIR